MLPRALLITMMASLLAFSGCDGPNERLSATNIISVRPGMSMDQVIGILGAPISEESRPGLDFYCTCNPEHTCTDSCWYTFTYTAKVAAYLSTYPKLLVHFNCRKTVREVFVKENGDQGVYWVRQNPCDHTDPIIPANAADSAKIDVLRKLFGR